MNKKTSGKDAFVIETGASQVSEYHPVSALWDVTGMTGQVVLYVIVFLALSQDIVFSLFLIIIDFLYLRPWMVYGYP